jgi:CRP-like cAMP-binding protein
VICRQGEIGQKLFIIRQGKINCIVDENIVDTLGANEYFGERCILNKTSKRAATCVVASEIACIYSIERKIISNIFGENYKIIL